MSQGSFFAIDRFVWEQACNLGMNPACTLLVMGAGTQKNNKTTSWSANAVEKRTGISRGRAKSAQESLIRNGLVEKTKGGKKPRFNIKKECEDAVLIWLPNEFVTGLEGVVSPLERVRQTGDVMTLKLLVDLYWINSPADDGGIPSNCIHQMYEREMISETGNMIVYGFNPKHSTCFNTHAVVQPHYDKKTHSAEKFFERFRTLTDLGLVSIVPFLMETDEIDSEYIHPLMNPYTGEDDLSYLARENALALIGDGYTYHAECFDYVIPVVRHRANNTVRGIAFLKYRPKTSLTAAGYANLQESYHHWLEIYASVQDEPTKIAVG